MNLKMTNEKKLNPLCMDQKEYVRERFKEMPKDVINFFDFKYDDARVSIENEFRAEWYRFRHDAIQELVFSLDKKYRAAKNILIKKGMSKEEVDLAIDKESLTVGDLGIVDF
jgi:hypothetical protein